MRGKKKGLGDANGDKWMDVFAGMLMENLIDKDMAQDMVICYCIVLLVANILNVVEWSPLLSSATTS